jgi:hypothetical protein
VWTDVKVPMEALVIDRKSVVLPVDRSGTGHQDGAPAARVVTATMGLFERIWQAAVRDRPCRRRVDPGSGRAASTSLPRLAIRRASGHGIAHWSRPGPPEPRRRPRRPGATAGRRSVRPRPAAAASRGSAATRAGLLPDDCPARSSGAAMVCAGSRPARATGAAACRSAWEPGTCQGRSPCCLLMSSE